MPLRGQDFARHPVRRIEARAGHELAPHRYPRSIPAVAQVLRDGLDLAPGVTFLVGENGSGKSTLAEAALSFSSTLGLVATLQRVVARRGQVLCATHSPVLAAMPGARILEAGPWGLREAAWEDLEVVDHWRRYLAEPWAYLRHLQDD